ncbi:MULTISPECIES: NUDIX hydrolase [Corynebacterium]|uniref:NUDIX hydrolase n=1 Tax=Corynebacterium TaxID=1716 RepID=UPI00124E99DF|nr:MULTISPECIES: NUDIX domain-containing protein [Corynebacterium]
MATGVVRVTAVVVRDEHGHVLAVRKRGTTRFMQPGGKPEPGESPKDTGIRELREEIGLVLTPEELDSLGYFEAPAANEAGWVVSADVFVCTRLLSAAEAAAIAPAAEIEELLWMDPHRLSDYGVECAPLMVREILPRLGT